MYAIIETGGKQYRVTPGDVVSVEKLAGEVGQTLTFDKILLIGGKADQQVQVGKPYLTSASLQAEVVQQSKGDKLLTIKYRRRKGYRRTIGHRQLLTRVLITKLDDGKGQSLQFDAAKRSEALIKASVPFSSKKKAVKAAAEASAPAKTKKKAATTAGAATKTASKKTASKAKA